VCVYTKGKCERLGRERSVQNETQAYTQTYTYTYLHTDTLGGNRFGECAFELPLHELSRNIFYLGQPQ
jgi:hypothetical protein